LTDSLHRAHGKRTPDVLAHAEGTYHTNAFMEQRHDQENPYHESNFNQQPPFAGRYRLASGAS